MPQPNSTHLQSAASSSTVGTANELRAVLGPAGALARTLAGDLPACGSEYRRLAQLADMIGFANAVLGQIISAGSEIRQVCSEFSVDAMMREILPMLHASVQGRATVSLTEDSHSPLLRGNPLALKRALLQVVLTLARTIEVPRGRIDIGVALITSAYGTASGDDPGFTPHRRVVRLTVVDNGIGMDPDRINALLLSGSDAEPLARWEDAGMQLACRIVKDHGGLLDIESHSGIGTMVRIDLPLASAGPCASGGMP